MAGIVKNLDSALKANNLEKVAQTMDQVGAAVPAEVDSRWGGQPLGWTAAGVDSHWGGQPPRLAAWHRGHASRPARSSGTLGAALRAC